MALTLRAYARHRRCTLNAVQCAIRDGRITTPIRSAASADKQWAENSLPSNRTARRRRGPRGPTGERSSKFPPAAESHRQLLALRVAAAQREGDIARGAYVPREAMHLAITEFVSRLKNLLLDVPFNIAAELSGADPEQEQRIIGVAKRWVDEVFDGMQQRPDASDGKEDAEAARAT